jgi:hypothetical protein
VDSPINDRLLSLKLTEQQIRNNHNVKSAKALGLVIEREIGEPAIISAVGVDNELHRWRRNIPSI